MVMLGALLPLALAWLIYSGPPRHLSIACGAPGRPTALLADRYARVLARQHVALRQHTTAGTLESLDMLATPGSGVDLAFVQGGVTTAEQSPDLVSLGSIEYVPLWIFHRRSLGNALLLQDLKGRRVALGSARTGLNRVAGKVLALAGVNEASSRFSPLSGAAAVKALEVGEVDAAVFMGPPEDPLIQGLFRNPELRLLQIDEISAIRARLPFLHLLTLPRGAIDLAARIPPADVPLLASTMTLVTRESLHPALVYLLMEALTEVHRQPGLLNEKNTFPADRDVDLPLSPTAERYFRSGTPFLQRHLPFWLASALDRALFALIPLAAILIPALRLLPALYAWRVRSRLFRWYAKLLQLEARTMDTRHPMDREEILRALDQIEAGVNGLRIPLAFTHERYILREHIELVRRSRAQPNGGK